MKKIYLKAILTLVAFTFILSNSCFSQDAGVSNILSPVNETCGSTATIVRVIVNNYGTTTISTIPVTATITGSLSVTLVDTLKKTILSGKQDTLTFKKTINTN